jgi:hypothetical protein
MQDRCAKNGSQKKDYDTIRFYFKRRGGHYRLLRLYIVAVHDLVAAMTDFNHTSIKKGRANINQFVLPFLSRGHAATRPGSKPRGVFVLVSIDYCRCHPIFRIGMTFERFIFSISLIALRSDMAVAFSGGNACMAQ